MKKNILKLSILVIFALSLLLITNPSNAQAPVVHAVLFYSDTCPHCHKVITEDLPPLMEKYGDRLVIVGINTFTEQGYLLYEEAVIRYQIPKERFGVPTLIVGDIVLVGSIEIPTQFPSIVEQGLVSGNGIGWPDLPSLMELLEAENRTDTKQDEQKNTDSRDIETDTPMVEEKTATGTYPSTEEPKMIPPDPPDNSIPAVGEVAMGETIEESVSLEGDPVGTGIDFPGEAISSGRNSFSQRFARDKLGNTISVFVLLGMVLSVVGVGITIAKPVLDVQQWPDWIIPILVVIGGGVAFYMGYVEITQSEAVCGPVGDCNTVQQSSYAYLFGIIPIGVFGVAGYVLIGFMWLILHWGPSRWQKGSSFILWGLAVFGTLFSIYLTFLEPFVIGATCAWCLTSAIIMTCILWATTSPLVESWRAKK